MRKQPYAEGARWGAVSGIFVCTMAEHCAPLWILTPGVPRSAPYFSYERDGGRRGKKLCANCDVLKLENLEAAPFWTPTCAPAAPAMPCARRAMSLLCLASLQFCYSTNAEKKGRRDWELHFNPSRPQSPRRNLTLPCGARDSVATSLPWVQSGLRGGFPLQYCTSPMLMMMKSRFFLGHVEEELLLSDASPVPRLPASPRWPCRKSLAANSFGVVMVQALRSL